MFFVAIPGVRAEALGCCTSGFGSSACGIAQDERNAPTRIKSGIFITPSVRKLRHYFLGAGRDVEAPVFTDSATTVPQILGATAALAAMEKKERQQNKNQAKL
jgi:hypothetical protein